MPKTETTLMKRPDKVVTINSNSNQKLIDEAEEAVRQAELEAETNKQGKPKDPKKPDNTVDWKKRYADLRRHGSEQDRKHKEELEALRKRLEEKDGQDLNLPASAEDIEQWQKDYPEASRIVESLVISRARETTESELQEARDQIAAIQKDTAVARREKAEVKISKVHPEYEDLKSDNDFHDWADDQPKWVQDALYENADDPDSVIRVLDLYKLDSGAKAKETDENSLDNKAATYVGPGSSTNIETGAENFKFSESQVNAMTAAEYEKNEAAIMESIQEGTFLYDMK